MMTSVATSEKRKAVVLVVEDDIHLLEGIRDILGLDGYDVLTAENGLRALEVLESHPGVPDLIVSDIMMPKMDGIQFLKEIRKQERLFTIPFIFLTARGERPDVHRGLRLGVDDYIVKPYDPQDLLVKIESRLERHRVLDDLHKTGLSALKRQILTMLNHEFRTPLTFVVAYAEMLRNPGEHKLTEKDVTSYVDGISVGAERLRNLIENFITLVELETGSARNTYDWRSGMIANAEQIFVDAQERVPTLIRRQVKLEIAPNLPLFAGDSEYLSIAIAQLLSNADKFSPKDTPIEAGIQHHNGEIIFWVRDYGRGIPPAEVENIWKSFYQIDRALNEDQGAGAGLAIVDGIVQLHDGRRQVESALGKGSTFRIFLAAADSLH